MGEQDKSYLDENLTDEEKESGRLRQPNQTEEKPYPGEENRADKTFERPDEFGDGDRRS